MRRRDFVTLLSYAGAGWPLAVHAQQPSTHVIGWISAAPAPEPRNTEAFRQGLREAGFIDGQSVRIEYRWAENGYAQLPELAADLVGRKVDAIIASGGSVSALAAKKVTTTIPIVFASVGADPIK